MRCLTSKTCISYPWRCLSSSVSGSFQDWSANQAISSLGRDFDDETVKSIMGPQWTKTRLEAEYKKRKTPSSQVHAELQVILAATGHIGTDGRVFGYIGCSKRSCFLCGKFIKAYGGLATRGYHGKLFDLWTVPEISNIPESEALKIATSFQQVEDDMKRTLCAPLSGRLQHTEESTVGDTRVSKVMKSFSSPDMAKLASRRLYIDRKASGHAYHSRDEADDGGMMSDDIIEPPEVESRPASPGPTLGGQFGTGFEECDVCELPTRRPCSLCGPDRFCSHKCQVEMSHSHAANCCNRGVTTTDELMVFVFVDRILEHEHVDLRDQLGFNRCQTQHDESFLLGLYQGLMIFQDFEVSARKLDAWRKGGQLTAKIHELYTQIPEGSRGSYYPWFQRNQHTLNSFCPSAKRCEDVISWVMDQARPYLPPEDRGIRDLWGFQPPEKAGCFTLVLRPSSAGRSATPRRRA